jgi:hypothetical protein
MQFQWTRQNELVRSALRPEDRVLILGVGGWFGQTFRHLVPANTPVLCHVARTSDQPSKEFMAQVRAFKPTIVANFAFLTPHFLRVMTDADYLTTNRLVFERFQDAMSLSGVRLGLHASSGAVTTPETDLAPEYAIYQQVKSGEEAILAQSDFRDRCVVVRAFSVSGPYVRVPEKYAISDMVGQALGGRIRVLSSRPTWRRFCSVADLLAVALAVGGQSGGQVLESGGRLCEMRALAEVIAEVVAPDASIALEEWVTDEPSIYASDDDSWSRACDSLGHTPMELPEQIREVRDFLQASRA